VFRHLRRAAKRDTKAVAAGIAAEANQRRIYWSADAFCRAKPRPRGSLLRTETCSVRNGALS